MKTKTFDAAEMKRKGSLAIYERIKDMTPEQELGYWRKQNETFQREQEKLSRAARARNRRRGKTD